MTDHVRPPIDQETYQRAAAEAEAHGVPVAAWIGALIESADEEPAVAAAAQRELQAWREGSAVPYRGLGEVLSSEYPCLCLASGGWRDEASQPGQFSRSGYGVAATHYGRAVAPAARGYWRMAEPDGSQGVRVIVFRRGSVRMHGWVPPNDDLPAWPVMQGDEDTRVPRRYAHALWVASGYQWLEYSSGRTTDLLDAGDLVIDQQLSRLVVVPDGNRNPVSWLRDLRRGAVSPTVSGEVDASGRRVLEAL